MFWFTLQSFKEIDWTFMIAYGWKRVKFYYDNKWNQDFKKREMLVSMNNG